MPLSDYLPSPSNIYAIITSTSSNVYETITYASSNIYETITSIPSNAIRFVVTTPAEIAKLSVHYPSVTIGFLGATMGYLVGGPKIAVASCSLNLLDKFLTDHDHTSARYISAAITGATAVSLSSIVKKETINYKYVAISAAVSALSQSSLIEPLKPLASPILITTISLCSNAPYKAFTIPAAWALIAYEFGYNPNNTTMPYSTFAASFVIANANLASSKLSTGKYLITNLFLSLGIYSELNALFYNNISHDIDIENNQALKIILPEKTIGNTMLDLRVINMQSLIAQTIFTMKISSLSGALDGIIINISKGSVDFASYYAKTISVITLSSVNFFISLTSDNIKAFYTANLSAELVDRIDTKLTQNQNAAKFYLYNKNLYPDVDLIQTDSYLIVNKYVEFNTKHDITLSKAVSSAFVLANYPGIISAAALMINPILNFITEELEYNSVVNNPEISKMTTMILELSKNDVSFGEFIVETGGENYLRHQLQQLVDAKRELHEQQHPFVNANNKWKDLLPVLKNILPSLAIAYEVYNTASSQSAINLPTSPVSSTSPTSSTSPIALTPIAQKLGLINIDKGEHKTILDHSKSVSSISEFHSSSTAQSNQLNIAINKLSSIINALDARPSRSFHDKNFVSVSSDYPKAGIEFKNFSLIREESPTTKLKFLNIPDLFLPASKVIEIRGENGSGKSSLAKKMAGVDYNYIESSGAINFITSEGLTPKVIYISQKPYIPLYSDFASFLLYPEIPTDEEKKVLMIRAAELIEQMRFYEDESPKFEFTEVIDWKSINGGKIQKAKIISTILRKELDQIREPNTNYRYTLICDECFSALDSHGENNSRLIAQNILRKYFPDANLLVIHHQSSSEDSFYDCTVNIIGGSATISC